MAAGRTMRAMPSASSTRRRLRCIGDDLPWLPGSFPLAIGLPPEATTRCRRTYDAGMARARLVGINHVALEVGDLDAALELYGRLFAFELRGRVRGMAFIDMGDQLIADAEGRSQAPDDDRHFGLVVDDVDAARTAVEREGLKLLGRRRGQSFDFRDPWGNRFQVVGYRNIQFERTDGVRRKLGIDGVQKTDAAQAEIADRGLAS